MHEKGTHIGGATLPETGEPVFLGSAAATGKDLRRALAVGALLVAAFAVTGPWADRPWHAAPAFALVYDAAVLVLDLITALLLYAQYRQLGERSFLALACGYLFTPLLVAAHSLSFPGAFGPGSLIGGEQSTAWLWMAWHGLFPFFVAGYAVLARRERRGGAKPPPNAGPRVAAVAVAGTVALAVAAVLLATLAEPLLPDLMAGDSYRSLTTQLVLSAGWLAHLAALSLLVWCTRLRRLIDLWVGVTLVALLIDLALSAVLVSGRYQFGWYLGRVYGLLGASFVLAVLLRETVGLYGSAVRSAAGLRESRERLRRMVNIEGVGVLRFDAAGTLVDANDYFLRMFGYGREEVAAGALTWRSMTPPEYVAESERQLQRLAATGRIGPFEKEYLRKDGSRSWLVFAGAALGDGTVIEYCIDVGDRKRAEEALREREAWLRGQREALEAALNGAPLEASLGVLVRTATEALGEGTRVAFYLAKVDGTSLRHVVGMPADYAEAVDGFKIGAESLACGLATHTGEPVLTADVMADPRWGPWRWMAARFDYRGCWSFPVRTSAGKFVGTFAVYSRRPRAATARDLELASLLTHTASMIISRHTELEARQWAEAALRGAHDELEGRVAERTAALEAEIARRADLARRLATAQEDERRRVARDLHDSVGQLLAGLALAVKAVAATPLPAAAADSLADVQRTADALGGEVHGLAVRLRPTALDDVGLAAALGQLVGEWSARTGVPVDFQTAGLGAGRLPPEAETVLYRVVQEALTNVARHAAASQVSVVVSRHDGQATAVVEDDGAGFDPAADARGRLGLVGMRERVALAGGELDVESRPGSGTTVIARVPAGGEP